MGKGLIEFAPAQGMAAQSTAAAVILASSQLGIPLSTTQVASGSIVGSGVGRPGALVRWAVAGRMVLAWLVTLPASAIVGGAMWWIGDLIGGLAGALVIVVILIALATFMYLRSRRKPVDATNVNDEWDASPETEPVTVGAS